MGNKVKLGIVGAGVLGRFHTKLSAANPDVEVVGVFAVNAEAAQNALRHYVFTLLKQEIAQGLVALFARSKTLQLARNELWQTSHSVYTLQFHRTVLLGLKLFRNLAHQTLL